VTIPAPFRPYFFAKESHKAVVEYYSKRKKIPVWVESTELKTLDGQPVVKVEVEQPYQVATLRDIMAFESFEADVPYVRRTCIDEDWKTSTSYLKIYYDVECKDSKVVCIALAGDDGQVELLTGDEKDILVGFADVASQVDMLLGYNSDNYDVPVLKARFRHHQLEFPSMQRWYDLLPALRWMRQRMLPSWSLEWVGKNLVGIERIHTDKSFSELTMQEIYERCKRDVEITYELDRKLSLSIIDIMKAHISYIFPDEANLVSRCVDSLLLKRARELGLVLPNKPVKPDTQQHSGAFVAQPPEAFRIYHNVLFLDVVSLYPNIIIGFKVSPDTERLLYPSILDSIIKERLRYKQLYRDTGDKQYDYLQYAYKTLANASYGCFNATGFRIQRPDLGDEVARHGREIVTSLIDYYRSLSFNVIYADTDSVVLSNIAPDDELFMMLAEAGSKHIKDVFGIVMQVEAKKFYSKLYFTRKAEGNTAAKKKYSGRVVWTSDSGWLSKPELDVAGIELVRSDFPLVAQRLQRKLIEGYLDGKSKAELQGILFEFKQALFEGLISPDELAFSRSITRTNYKVTAPHVRVASKLRETGTAVNVGDKIRFVYTRWGPLPVEQCKDVPIDTAYYWKRVFLPIAERTLGITGEVKLDRWLESDM
jgi:DNA polymerase I